MRCVLYGVFWGVDMKNIKHCNSCKDGRLIRHSGMIFCGFCGKEYNINRTKW